MLTAGVFRHHKASELHHNLGLFEGASSCSSPSIMTAPMPSGIASRIFFSKAASMGSGLNTRLAISIFQLRVSRLTGATGDAYGD
jgi:hypothetical protein